MANVVGMTVLHPGGLKATERSADLCHIDKDSRALDIACGKGTSAVYLARKYGCQRKSMFQVFNPELFLVSTKLLDDSDSSQYNSLSRKTQNQ